VRLDLGSDMERRCRVVLFTRSCFVAGVLFLRGLALMHGPWMDELEGLAATNTVLYGVDAKQDTRVYCIVSCWNAQSKFNN
jgi:hypothetical protein